MLYSVHAVFGVCFTPCMLYSVYPILGANSWSWHGEIQRDDLTLYHAMMVELWTREREMGDEDEYDVEDYELIWAIRGTTCLIRLGWPCIGVITGRIGTRTCCIRDGTLSRTRNSLKSQFLTVISPVPFHLFLSCPQFYHHLRIRSYVIPLYLSMPQSRVDTEYSIYRLLHTLEYCMHCVLHHPKIDCLLLPASLISQLTMLYSILYICTIPSQPMNRVSAPVTPPSGTTASRLSVS